MMRSHSPSPLSLYYSYNLIYKHTTYTYIHYIYFGLLGRFWQAVTSSAGRGMRGGTNYLLLILLKLILREEKSLSFWGVAEEKIFLVLVASLVLLRIRP